MLIVCHHRALNIMHETKRRNNRRCLLPLLLNSNNTSTHHCLAVTLAMQTKVERVSNDIKSCEQKQSKMCARAREQKEDGVIRKLAAQRSDKTIERDVKMSVEVDSLEPKSMQSKITRRKNNSFR